MLENTGILVVFRGFPTSFRPKRRLADSDSEVFRSAQTISICLVKPLYAIYPSDEIRSRLRV